MGLCRARCGDWESDPLKIEPDSSESPTSNVGTASEYYATHEWTRGHDPGFDLKNSVAHAGHSCCKSGYFESTRIACGAGHISRILRVHA